MVILLRAWVLPVNYLLTYVERVPSYQLWTLQFEAKSCSSSQWVYTATTAPCRRPQLWWRRRCSAPGATCQVQPQLPWVLWTLLHAPRIWATLPTTASTAYAAPLVSFPNYTGGYICWCWSAYQGYPCLAQGCQGTCFESQQVILALPYNPVMSLN